jgi:hypothetical protein
MYRRISFVMCAALTIAACSSSSGSPASNDDGGATDGAVAMDASGAMDASPQSDANNLAGNSVMGTVAGNTIVVADAIVYDESATIMSMLPNDAGADVVERSVKLENFTGACMLQQMNDTHKASSVYLKLMFGNAQKMPIAPGDFPVVSISSAFQPGMGATGAAYVKANNNVCLPHETDATGGTITVANVSAAGISGSFTLTFPNSEMLTGTFNAASCDVQPPTGIGGCQM